MRWLSGGSIAAAAALIAMSPQSATAQTTANGSAVNASLSFDNTQIQYTQGINQDVVTVNASEAIIDWTTNDAGGSGPVTFLPAGNILTFNSDAASYTVLNRIITPGTDSAIRFDGQVTSLVNSGAAVGGNIWFYSPGGIIVGSTGRFDVGSLALSTTDLDVSGGFPSAFGGTISATGNVGGGTIRIDTIDTSADATAQIELANESSYLAIVAPRIEQAGSLDVNGAVALVAAEQATLTINNNNLFDIQIPVGGGTSDGNGIVHSGTTGGPAPLNGSDRHNVYLVAVPKTQAMTMLLGGTIGHGVAASASIGDDDGQIILSAGGNIDRPSSFRNSINETIDPAKNASISIGDASVGGVNFNGHVRAFANNNLSLTTSVGNDINALTQNRDDGAAFTAGDSINITAGADSNINLDITGERAETQFSAQNGISVTVDPGAEFRINGNLELNAFSDTQGGIVDIDVTGPGARIDGSGELVVTGTFDIFAGVDGTRSRFATVDDGTDTFGGTINVNITQGGFLSIDSSAAFGVGDSTFSASTSANHGTTTGADSFGGTVNFNVLGTGSTLNVVGFSGLELQARGNSTSTFRGSSTGGSGTGGAVNLTVDGGAITADLLSIDAGASGSSNASSNTNESLNSAFSGDVTATFTDATLNIDQLSLLTGASAGRSFDAMGNLITGNAAGGDLAVTFDNTNFTGASLGLNGDAFGTNTVINGQVAEGDEGSTTLNILNGSTLALTGNFNMSGQGSADADGTSGSADINFLVDNAIFSAANINLNNGRTTRAPAGTSDGLPGDINFTVQNSGSVTTGILSLTASAFNSVPGGQATAGNVNLLVDGGALTLTEATSTSLRISTSGVGSDNDGSTGDTTPGLGIGGDIDVTLQGGGTMIMGTATFRGDGLIAGVIDGQGVEPSGEGGSGVGGSVTFNLNGSTFTATDLTVSASGVASAGGDSTIDDPFLGIIPNVVGDGGTGTGGDVTFNLRGTDVMVNNLTVAADGSGGGGGSSRETEGVSAGNGGQGIGGSATFNANSGTLDVANTLTVSAGGFGGQGGTGEGVDAGNGGNSTGGTAIFNLDGTADVNIGTGGIIVSSNTTGGAGGNALVGNAPSPTPTPAQNSGQGGGAVAGTATFNNLSGTISFNDLSVTAVGTGGAAGQGGINTPMIDPSTGELVNVFTPSFVGQNGGNGGTGTGGNATINIGQDDANAVVYTVNASGVGAGGSNGFNGGDGGIGTGGDAVLNIIDATVVLDDPTIVANAIGGTGGTGNTDATTGAIGDSGNGGSATGGTARLEVTGAGSDIDLGFLVLEANADGGSGANGAGSFDLFSGNVAGDGGSGGSADGGTVELIARTEATINVTSGNFSMTSTGDGGDGGSGGYGSYNPPGNGGDAGSATGGTARILSQGATISGNDLTITTTGTAGDAGNGGYGFYGSPGGYSGVVGSGAGGTGGTGIIEVQEGSPGIVSFNDVLIEANGTGGIGGTGAGGRIEITDTSTDPSGLITLNDLTVNAFDTAIGTGAFSPSVPTGGFFTTGNSGAINVLGNLIVDVAGDIQYDFDGTGQMTIGGSTQLRSGQDITVNHLNNNASTFSIDSTDSFTAIASNGNISANLGSIISTGNEMTIIAGGDIIADDLRAVPFIVLEAGQNVTLNDAIATGPQGVSNLSGITIDAGRQNVGVIVYDPLFNATITGTVQSYRDITIRAGGVAQFTSTASLIADNQLSVETFDDIIVDAGASLVSAVNPFVLPDPLDPFPSGPNIILSAGSLPPLSTPFTPIASIIAAGSLNANTGAVVLSANAIDGLGGTITAGSLAADIVDAPPNGIPPLDDDGLLSTQCLQGNVCLGNINVDNIVEIGQASNIDVIQAVVESGTVMADIIRVTTRNDIVMGTDRIASTLVGGNEVSLESTEGNINLRDASLTSDQLQITAAGSLEGSGALGSSNSIGISVGSDINAASIDTGQELAVTAGGTPGSYFVPGNMIVGSFSIGSGNVNYTAGGDFVFDSISVPGTDINLNAGGNVSIDFSDSANNIDITATDINIGDVSAFGDVILGAGGVVDFGSVDAGGVLDITAGDVFGGFAGGSDIGITGSTIDISNVSGGNVNIDGDDVNIGGADGSDVFISGTAGVNVSGVSGSTIDIQGGGVGVGSAFGGSIDIIGDVVFVNDADGDGITIRSAADVTANTLISANSIDVEAGGGDVTGTGDWNADGSITIDNAANIDLNNLTSGDALTLSALSVSVGDTTSQSGAVSLTATAGTVAARTVTSSGLGAGLSLAASGATGNISAESLVSNSGDILVSAGQSITIGSAATGAGTPTAGTIAVLAGGSFSSTGVLAAGEDLAIQSVGNVVLATASAGDDFTVRSDGTIVLGSATTSGTGIDLFSPIFNPTDNGNAGTIFFGVENLTGSNIQLNGAGDVTATGTLNAINNISITSGGEITVPIMETTGGNILLDAIGAIDADHAEANGDFTANGLSIRTGLNSIITGGDIIINVDDIADLGNSNAGGLVDVRASQIDFVTLISGGTIDLLTQAPISVPGIIGNGNITGADMTAGTGTSNVTAGFDQGNIAITGTSIAAGTLNMTALADITVGDVTADEALSLITTGVITGDALQANGNIDIGITVSQIVNGDVDVASVTTGGFTGTTVQAGGALDLRTKGDINFDSADSALNNTIVAFDNALTANSISSGTNVNVNTGTSLSATSIIANKTGQGSISLRSGDTMTIGSISGNDGDLRTTAGGINITGDVDVTNVTSAFGDFISIIAQNDLAASAIARAGDISIAAGGDLDVQGTQASGDILLSADGSATISDIFVSDAGTLSNFTTAQSTASTGGDVIINAGTDALLDNAVSALNALQITAGGLIDISANAVGAEILTNSADLNITGALGQNTLTTNIEIQSNGTTQVVLGGDGTATGVFNLDNGEFDRVQSGGDLNITAIETGLSGFDLTILDLNASAFDDGNFGLDASFNVTAEQSIRVDGNLSVGGGNDSGLDLAAGDDLFINANGGGVRVNNDGDLSGNLSFTARNIYVMTDQAFADIDGMSTAEIDARLADNDGIVSDTGIVFARSLSVNLLASQFYVQNIGSGTGFDARRGFTIGAGGLAINTGPSGVTPIVINGTIGGVTGIPVIPATTITGAGFNAQSTINGCVIANPASCAPVTPSPTPTPTPTPAEPMLDDPVQDVIEEEVTPKSGSLVTDAFETNLIELKDTEEYADDPLIDEPVTGAGNDDLWIDETSCEGAEEGENCGVGGPIEEELEPAE
ncbi:MAG: hypothetical protein ABJN65_01400 [Parasphingorhabdus sp.]